ncbi:hypothetical protein GCM10022237_44840 [Nocardioides ginsengisoli]
MTATLSGDSSPCATVLPAGGAAASELGVSIAPVTAVAALAATRTRRARAVLGIREVREV